MILDEIVKQRRIQLEKETARCTLWDMKKRAEEQLARRTPLSLAKALRQETLSCICEVKKASPSKGLIRPDFRPVQFAKEYEAAGADAISCLTEEHYFQGSSEYLAAIRKEVGIPILRKDFIFDEYQIFEAAALGADAVLLIAAVLDTGDEKSKEDMVIGVNNRNLKTFEVSLDTVAKLRPYAPESAVFVSESGIKTNEDMKMVRSLGADAVLIGETLMRAESITDELHKLREGI